MSNYWDDIEDETLRENIKASEDYRADLIKDIEFGLSLPMFKEEKNIDRLNEIIAKINDFIIKEFNGSTEDTNIFMMALKQAEVKISQLGIELLYEDYLEDD